MKNPKVILSNEKGFVLIGSLLVLLLLLIMGVAATNTTTVELLISGNEKVHKETFYQADAGTELGIRLTYENAMCINSSGFQNPGSDLNLGLITIPQDKLDFATPGVTATLDYYPERPTLTPKTEITVNGQLLASAGSGLQQVAGYEGLGKGAAGGGTHVLYDISSEHQGAVNSKSIIAIQWKLSSHLINSASSDDCKF